jgi:transcriptional regulator with XRE-family HTH domain
LIAGNIRKIRRERGLTVEVLAKKVGVSQPHMTRLELGRCQCVPDVLSRIAKVLKVPPWFLLMSEDEQVKAERHGRG